MSRLNTPTFETLRERNDRSLNRLNYAAGVDISRYSSNQQARIEHLLRSRDTIDQLASFEGQQEEYGADDWHRTFIRLGDETMASVHGLPYEGEQLRNFVWNALPNSRFKRFQELFCKPANFVIPHFTVDAKKNVIFENVHALNEMSLKGCLVSADLIPDKFAEDLKLCDFAGNERDPVGRLKKKHAAIQKLKLIFESAEQLQPGHHRIQRIAHPGKDADARYSVEGPDPSIVGTILYTREQENGRNGTSKKRKEPKKPRKLIVQHFDSAYAAHRKTDHEQLVHMRETDTLADLKEELGAFNEKLNREWKADTDEALKAAMHSEAILLIGNANAILAPSVNRQKLEASEFLQGAMPLADARQISATMSKITASVTRLETRLKIMRPIGGFNTQDQLVLHERLRTDEKRLKTFRSHLARNAHVLRNGVLLFGESELSQAQLLSNVTGMEHRLEADVSSLAKVELEPLQTYARRIQAEYALFHDALVKRDREAAIAQAIKMHVVGKLQAARTCIEHIKGFTVNAERISLSKVREFASTMQGICGAREIFPDRTVESFEEPYAELSESIDTIAGKLAAYDEEEGDLEAKTALYEELTEYVDTVDVESILSRLPYAAPVAESL